MLPSELLERTWVGRCPNDLSKENCLISAFSACEVWVEGEPILIKLTGDTFPHRWNDTHTKEEVVAVARLAEYRLGLRPMETEGEERASAVVAHALVN